MGPNFFKSNATSLKLALATLSFGGFLCDASAEHYVLCRGGSQSPNTITYRGRTYPAPKGTDEVLTTLYVPEGRCPPGKRIPVVENAAFNASISAHENKLHQLDQEKSELKTSHQNLNAKIDQMQTEIKDLINETPNRILAAEAVQQMKSEIIEEVKKTFRQESFPETIR